MGVTKENKCLKSQIVGETGTGMGEAPREIGSNLKQFPVILMFHDSTDSTFHWRKIEL